LRILHVIPYFAPRFGGDVDVCYHMARAQARRGHQVTVLTTDHGFDREYASSLGPVTVMPVPAVFGRGLISYSPGMGRWLGSNLGDYDIAHLHTVRSYQNIVLHGAAVKAKVPYVVQAHGSVLPIVQRERMKRIYDAAFGHRLLGDSAKMIAVSEAEVAQYLRMGVPDRSIERIPNGIDGSDFRDLPPRGGIREKYGIDANQKVVLFLGRLHRVKGPDLLVRAFSDLVKEEKGWVLAIAGPDDGFLAAVRGLVEDLGISDAVRFTGPLFGRAKLEAYVDADLFVLPTRYDVFSVTVLEAFACGLPVMTTRQCGLADLVSDYGLVVEATAPALSRGLSSAAGGLDQMREKAARGREEVLEVYDWEKIMDRVDALYDGVLRARGGAPT
jgi:glycosyltransferase involved in cell wall biosynthesis